MLILGIVGAPAGGKSTVAKRLQEHGAAWINADQIARQVLERDDIQARLINHFGREIADNQGRIERGRLADLVFGDDENKRTALAYLESVIHPETRRVIAEQLKLAWERRVVASILDVPLLFESHWDRSCDEICCVDSDWNTRLLRAHARGWDEIELKRREANQIPISVKRRLSTIVLDNGGTVDELHELIDNWWLVLEQRQQDFPIQTHCDFEP